MLYIFFSISNSLNFLVLSELFSYIHNYAHAHAHSVLPFILNFTTSVVTVFTVHNKRVYFQECLKRIMKVRSKLQKMQLTHLVAFEINVGNQNVALFRFGCLSDYIIILHKDRDMVCRFRKQFSSYFSLGYPLRLACLL